MTYLHSLTLNFKKWVGSVRSFADRHSIGFKQPIALDEQPTISKVFLPLLACWMAFYLALSGKIAFYLAPLAPTALAANVIIYLYYLLLFLILVRPIVEGLNLTGAFYWAGFMGNPSILARLRGAFILWCVVSFIFKYHGIEISLWWSDPDNFIACGIAAFAVLLIYPLLPPVEPDLLKGNIINASGPNGAQGKRET